MKVLVTSISLSTAALFSCIWTLNLNEFVYNFLDLHTDRSAQNLRPDIHTFDRIYLRERVSSSKAPFKRLLAIQIENYLFGR